MSDSSPSADQVFVKKRGILFLWNLGEAPVFNGLLSLLLAGMSLPRRRFAPATPPTHQRLRPTTVSRMIEIAHNYERLRHRVRYELSSEQHIECMR